MVKSKQYDCIDCRVRRAHLSFFPQSMINYAAAEFSGTILMFNARITLAMEA